MSVALARRRLGATARASQAVRSAFRRDAAMKAAPVIAVLVYAWATSAFVASSVDGYGLTASMRVISALPFVAPICAACAAWEVGRLRRGGIYDTTRCRSGLSVTARQIAPTLAIGVAALVESAVIVWPEVAAGRISPEPAVFAIGLAVLAGHVAFGVLWGRVLPAVIAVPGSFAVSYAWLVYPPAMNIPWIRHLTGFNDSCCLNIYKLTPGAILAPIVLALSVTAAALLVLSVRSRLLALGAGLAIFVSCLALAVRLVSGLGFDPVQPRTGPMACAGSSPRVCVWPEHAGMLAEALADTRRMAAVLRHFGLIVPRQATESIAPRPGPAWIFGIGLQDSPAQVRALVAVGVAPPGPPPCAQHANWSAANSLMALQAWLLLRDGLSQATANYWVIPDAMAILHRELAKPVTVQAAWFRQAMLAATTCAAHGGPSS